MNDSSEHTLVIEANKTELHYWKDLWRYRELFFFLSWRDILIRYKQTVIGIAWSVLRPLMTMIVFTFIFGKFAKLPSQGVPYAIMVYSAMLPWYFFSNSFSEASNSLINNTNLLTKVYFPRLIVPTSSIIVSFLDFIISFIIFLFLMVWYRFVPSWTFFTLPFFMILVLLTCLGAGYYVASLNVKYRDFRYVVPFIVQFGLYISPVGFSSAIVPKEWRLVYYLNPMAGAIDGFRWAILGGEHRIDPTGFSLSCAVAVCLFIYGTWYFRKLEKSFADII